ncbi:hypothetical protein [Psychroflexus maritimus]|uniref:Uncharacterized protein n=1 Tax=Psychroflexus maritimus TaxID=2714865 RepID=A0A967E1R7_9FLAO|nr:hypothetical protein [Psychroflexus maritimus]NGZ89059.1 hypothetical protein [Psychroflexus maritimus]
MSLSYEFTKGKKNSLLSDLFNSSGLEKNIKNPLIELELENSLRHRINQKK